MRQTILKPPERAINMLTVCDKVAHWDAGLCRRDSARPITTGKTGQPVNLIRCIIIRVPSVKSDAKLTSTCTRV